MDGLNPNAYIGVLRLIAQPWYADMIVAIGEFVQRLRAIGIPEEVVQSVIKKHLEQVVEESARYAVVVDP